MGTSLAEKNIITGGTGKTTVSLILPLSKLKKKSWKLVYFL